MGNGTYLSGPLIQMLRDGTLADEQDFCRSMTDVLSVFGDPSDPNVGAKSYSNKTVLEICARGNNKDYYLSYFPFMINAYYPC